MKHCLVSDHLALFTHTSNWEHIKLNFVPNFFPHKRISLEKLTLPEAKSSIGLHWYRTFVIQIKPFCYNRVKVLWYLWWYPTFSFGLPLLRDFGLPIKIIKIIWRTTRFLTFQQLVLHFGNLPYRLPPVVRMLQVQNYCFKITFGS